MRTRTKKIEQVAFKVNVLAKDISEGLCGLPGKCMEKIAIERVLRAKDPKGGDHHVRIDAGTVKFNLFGYRWRGIPPKIAKRSLIQFDKEEKARRKARKKGEEFTSKVQPHEYRLEAQKTTKIVPFTAERMKQVNAARNRRAAEGRPDRKDYNLRKRVVGLGSV